MGGSALVSESAEGTATGLGTMRDRSLLAGARTPQLAIRFLRVRVGAKPLAKALHANADTVTNTDDATFSNDKAVKAWGKACEANVGRACTSLGDLYSAQLNDDARGMEAFGKGCALNVMEACFRQGALLVNGDGVQRDGARGRMLAAKACAGGYAKACSR